MTFAKSFRWQLIGFSLLAGSLAVGAFGFLSWQVVLREKRAQIDLRLEAFASRYSPKLYSLIAQQQLPHRNVEILEAQTVSESGFQIMLFKEKGEIAWQSDNWPESVDPTPFHALSESFQPKLPQNQRLRFPANPNLRPSPLLNRPPPGARFPPTNAVPQIPVDNLIDFENIQFQTINTGVTEYRLLAVPAFKGCFLIVADMQLADDEMRSLQRAFLIAGPIALLLIAFGALLVGQKAIKPIRRLTHTTENISAHALHQRIPTQNEPAEFVRLIEVYNSMLARLERGFLQARRFSSDAAHELNTPLTILQGQIDAALQSAPLGSAEQKQYSQLLEEVKQLVDIVEKLLILSRADGNRLTIQKTVTNLAPTLRELAEDFQDMWETLTISTDISQTTDLSVNGDITMIRQIFSNLLSNACRYNRENGFVKLHARNESQALVVEITNSGSPIPQASVKKLFDRFYRADPSRKRKSPYQGLGLGLSLAKEFVQAHNGSVSLVNNTPDHITFQVKLPKT